jgi:hypothetical protein
MAIPTYTPIPDGSLAVGQPIRSVDGLALRDNLLAVTQGDPGAPQVWAQALRYVEFTSSGTFTVPTDCRLVFVEVWGAGGSGRRVATGNGQAGGAGGYSAGWVDVSAVSSVAVTVGAGGAGVSGAGVDGNAGGASSFGSTVVANGGLGGTATDVFNGGATASAASIPMAAQGARGAFGAVSTNPRGGLGIAGVGGGPNGDGNRVGGGGRATDATTSGAGFRGQVRVWY